MTVTAMNHFTVLAGDLANTQAFYKELLGLKEGYRPPFDFPGAWLYAGEQAVLHIIAGRELPKDPAGVLDHMAFSAAGLQDTIAKLERRKIDYLLRRQAGSRAWQLFFHDPNGAKVELDFAPEEPGPATGD
ncbi:MAG TPA: VOC family protein [Alphaproteobacteria bacterium]|nr:VOC family protein [Alphaproteobacteria bacterium]